MRLGGGWPSGSLTSATCLNWVAPYASALSRGKAGDLTCDHSQVVASSYPGQVAGPDGCGDE